MAHILLVEDDNSLIDGLIFSLERNNYKTQVARTVAESKEALAENSYDLLLLDVTLPDGTGFDICERIRKTSMVPVIFLTASDEELNVVRGLSIGGDDYIAKPFRLNELLARIQALLRRTGAEENIGKEIDRAEPEKASLAGKSLDSGSIKILLEEYKVLKDEKTVEVTANEYRLLCFFIQHSDQVLTREQIMDRLWDGNGEFVDDNTLSVYIRRLRNKIEDNPNKPEKLVTVRGIGYKWRA